MSKLLVVMTLSNRKMATLYFTPAHSRTSELKMLLFLLFALSHILKLNLYVMCGISNVIGGISEV